MTTATPPRPLPSLLEVPEIVDVRTPRWLRRLPRSVTAGAVLLVLMAVSAFIRTRTLSGELWFDEAGAVGLASQPFGSLLGAVHHAGAAPLYYVLLHFWISLFGNGETVTHTLVVADRAGLDPGRDVGRVEPGRASGRGSSRRCCSPSARS